MHNDLPTSQLTQTIAYNATLTFLSQSRYWLITGTLLGLFLAIIALFILPKKYEAQTLFRVGQITGEAIESPNNTVQRMKSLGFQEEIARLIVLSNPNYSTEETLLEIKKFPINVIKNTDMIELTITAPSIAEAIQRGKYYMNTIEKRHQELASPMLKSQQDQLVNAKEHLNAINNAGNTTNAQVTTRHPNYTLELDSNNEAIFWNQQILALNHALVFPNTRQTSLVEPITASIKPIFPKKNIFLILGSMIGFAVGLLSFSLRSKKPISA